jgi:O-antigen/teichoic acid export membrane protein
LKQRRIFADSRYIVIMSFAAMIALVRGFIVAGILDLTSFGLYATVVAVGMFSSAIVSFGEIERTLKIFPRLWVLEGYRRSVVERADESAWVMILRAGIFFMFFLICTFLDEIKFLTQTGMLVALIALSVGLSSLYASAIRATGDVELLARNTLFRALIVLVFGLLGAYYFSWQGAILGEILGAIVGVLVTRYSVLGKITIPIVNGKHIRKNAGIPPQSDKGLWLFFAGLLSSVPVYLDRAFVASVFGDAMLGTFGFILLFVTGANTFTGIIAQKVGPQLVKMEHLGGTINDQIRYASRWVALISVICTIGMALVMLLLFFGPARYFFEKFYLDLNLICATAVMCILQIGVILDSILISRNQEREIFIAACLYILIIGMVVWFTLWVKLSLVDFVWLLVLTKLLHIATQLGFIGRTWYEHKHQLPETK